MGLAVLGACLTTMRNVVPFQGLLLYFRHLKYENSTDNFPSSASCLYFQGMAGSLALILLSSSCERRACKPQLPERIDLQDETVILVFCFLLLV